MLIITFLQIGNLELTVVNEKGEAIGYCAYEVYKDTTKILGGYCDENGNIKINNLNYGNYKIKIEFLGYETKILNVNINKENVSLGKVSLNPKGIMLREQQVIAQPPTITYEQGKRVIRPSENISTTGGTALDVLRNTPGVNVDNNDNVEIRGSSNITLLINNRPTNLEISDALKQIPATQIDRIEIITNPSARYEAEGNIIVNIILKTTREEGRSYSINGRIGTYDNYGLNLLYGVSKNKLKISTSINYNKFSFNSNSQTKRIFSNETLLTSGDFNRWTNPYGLRLNLDYGSFSFEGSLNHWGFGMLSNSITNGSNYYKTNFDFKVGGINSSAYFGYNKNFINAGIYWTIRTFNENSETINKDQNDNVIYGFRNTESGPSSTIRFNFDYDNKTLAFGYLGNYNNSKDDVIYYNYQNGFIPYDSFSSNFYKITNALYFTYNKSFNRLNGQIGLRFERTDRSISNFKKQYNDFFPSLNLSYKISQFNEIYLNYSRRIEHPRPWLLEPYEVKLDQYTKRIGNPNLNPEYSHSFEIGFQNSIINIYGYYRKSENVIEQIVSYKDSFLINYPENVGFSEFFGSEFSTSYRKGKFFDFQGSINLYKMNLYSDLRKESFSYDIKSSIRILLLQISAVYNAPRKTSQGEIKENYYFDLGLRLPYKNFIFIFNFSDVFKTFTFNSENYNFNFYQSQNMSRKWPSIQFVLIYNFQDFRRLNKQKIREESDDMEGF
ncbi:MAG: TonB-dependent receptor [candidate division WOR-3 bacterium]